MRVSRFRAAGGDAGCCVLAAARACMTTSSSWAFLDLPSFIACHSRYISMYSSSATFNSDSVVMCSVPSPSSPAPV